MEAIGEFLEAIGRPLFAILFFVLVVGAGVGLIALSLPTLLRRERDAAA